MSEYIEREAALDIVNGWREQLIPTYGENDEYVKCLETVADHLEWIHAADVRPVVRGKWVSVTFRDVGCSECGFIMDIMETNKHILNHANFCPNCGCAMEES